MEIEGLVFLTDVYVSGGFGGILCLTQCLHSKWILEKLLRSVFHLLFMGTSQVDKSRCMNADLY